MPACSGPAAAGPAPTSAKSNALDRTNFLMGLGLLLDQASAHAGNIEQLRATCIGRSGTMSIAHELSGLGSTRVVRFCSPQRSGGNEPGDVATGPQDAEVQGRFEPLGTAGAVGLGRWRASGVVGAAITPLAAP